MQNILARSERAGMVVMHTKETPHSTIHEYIKSRKRKRL